ncbi:Bifunctional inhibitor/plant lipid transfer protein/seed storage helical domain [Dillenia turbinata]|uniref:Bifunctional inhibitor/plant lipid transfer protein/seed storage helical domain n=1 Tax=Dillenia turbinata TaxID=194707 RepID=A0AAN8VY12_9MAGN
MLNLSITKTRMHWLLACTFAMRLVGVSSGVDVQGPSVSPSPPSCDSIIYDMIDCVEFLTDGSNVTTPSPACCFGFQTVLKADCVCQALKSSQDLGIAVNLTRAVALPPACGVSNAPPISKCGMSLPPRAAPPYPPPPQPIPALPPTRIAPSPSAPITPITPGAHSPAPMWPSGGGGVAPAPATKKSAANSMTNCFGIVTGLVVASISYVLV